MSIWDWSPDQIVGGWEGRYPTRSAYDKLLLKIGPIRRNKAKNLRRALAELAATEPGLMAAKAQWLQPDVNLQSYVPYVPVKDIDLRKVDEAAVQAEFTHRMAQLPDRLAALGTLISPWGIVLDNTPVSLQALALWFCQYLRLFDKAAFLRHVAQSESDNPYYHRAPTLWYSIGTDIALYMGQMLVKEVPEAEWGISQHNPALHDFYHRPAVQCPSDPLLSVDFEVDVWALMALLHDHHLPASFVDAFHHAYRRARKDCQAPTPVPA